MISDTLYCDIVLLMGLPKVWGHKEYEDTSKF